MKRITDTMRLDWLAEQEVRVNGIFTALNCGRRKLNKAIDAEIKKSNAEGGRA